MKKKVLFINSCARPDSRTKELANHLLNSLDGEIVCVDLYEANIKPIDSFDLEKRTENIKNGNFFCQEFEQAKQLLRELAETSTLASSTEIMELAKEEGVSKRTMESAKRELQIPAKRINNTWYWDLSSISC